MNQSIKNAGYLVIGSALLFSVYSCHNNNKSSTSSADTTAAATTPAPPASPDTSAAATNANNTATPVDKNQDFVTSVIKANAMEIMMLHAGIDKGTSKMLKEDAKKMLVDHKHLAKELTDYAKKNNIMMPTIDTSMDMSDMGVQPGNDWDIAWDNKMIDGHQKTIAKFEAAENEVTDPALKDLITKTLPTLHKHLDMVQKLHDKLNS